MIAKKRSIAPGSASRTPGRRIRTDLAALDAHVPVPDDEAPEFAPHEIAGGVLTRNGKPIGRPKSLMRKQRITLRLSPGVLDWFRATGPGWQTRIDEALQRAVAKAR